MKIWLCEGSLPVCWRGECWCADWALPRPLTTLRRLRRRGCSDWRTVLQARRGYFVNNKIKYLWISVADPDPGSGAFLTPGSIVRDNKSGSGSGSLKTIFWVKILKFFPSQIQGQKDSRICILIKEIKYLTLKIWSKMFIPDSGSRGQKCTRSATLVKPIGTRT